MKNVAQKQKRQIWISVTSILSGEETTQSRRILRYKHDFLDFFFTMPFLLLVFVNLYSLQISDITLADMLRHTNIFG